MRILLSAFACDPNKGSEEGVGWSWAYQLAKEGHEVVVLTRGYHRQVIESKLREVGLPNLHFEYIGVGFVPFWMPGLSVYPHYFCWQWIAYFRARKLHHESPFDIVHHLTYGVFRNPSYLYLLNAPFVFGPVGGGERSPHLLRVSMSKAGQRFEALRDFANLLPYLDPFWWLMLRRCARIAAKTEETRRCLPQKSMERAVVTLENMVPNLPFLAGTSDRNPPLKVLYAGNLRPLKGVHLAIRAIAQLRSRTSVELTIVGDGPEEARLRDEVSSLKLEHCVRFFPWMPRTEVFAMYATHDALLFPSLHDSSGTVVMEAIAHGRPVICLDLGGPAATVDEHCARIVNTKGMTEEQVIQGLADALLEFALMPSKDWAEMRHAAIRRAQFYTPDLVIRRVYGPILKLQETQG